MVTNDEIHPVGEPSNEDYEGGLLADECEINGYHWFDSYDVHSEYCVHCGFVREYAARNMRAESSKSADDVHTCRIASDHVFQGGQCLYCEKHEATLTDNERRLRALDERVRS